MPNATVDVTITPIGTATVGISDYVAAAESVLKQYPQLEVSLNPMSTTLRGELAIILEAVQAMHNAAFAQGAQRVSTALRIDERRDGREQTLAQRVQVVQEKAAARS